MTRRTLFTRLLSALAAVPLVGKHLQAKPKLEMLFDTCELTYVESLTPQQQALLDCPAREVLFYGGRGSGRTFGARQWLSGSRRSIFLTAAQFNRMDRHDEELLRSLGYRDRIVIDNAENIESEDFYDAFVNRYPWTRICLTASPNGPARPWLTSRFFAEGHSNRRAIPAGTIFDNPAFTDEHKRAFAEFGRSTRDDD